MLEPDNPGGGSKVSYPARPEEGIQDTKQNSHHAHRGGACNGRASHGTRHPPGWKNEARWHRTQVCATLTGHAHMHGLYQKLKEVEAACAGVVSDAEAEVLGRLQAVEHEVWLVQGVPYGRWQSSILLTLNHTRHCYRAWFFCFSPTILNSSQDDPPLRFGNKEWADICAENENPLYICANCTLIQRVRSCLCMAATVQTVDLFGRDIHFCSFFVSKTFVNLFGYRRLITQKR